MPCIKTGLECHVTPHRSSSPAAVAGYPSAGPGARAGSLARLELTQRTGTMSTGCEPLCDTMACAIRARWARPRSRRSCPGWRSVGRWRCPRAGRCSRPRCSSINRCSAGICRGWTRSPGRSASRGCRRCCGWRRWHARRALLRRPAASSQRRLRGTARPLSLLATTPPGNPAAFPPPRRRFPGRHRADDAPRTGPKSLILEPGMASCRRRV